MYQTGIALDTPLSLGPCKPHPLQHMPQNSYITWTPKNLGIPSTSSLGLNITLARELSQNILCVVLIMVVPLSSNLFLADLTTQLWATYLKRLLVRHRLHFLKPGPQP